MDIKISQKESGARLDKFLTNRLAGQSRTAIKNLIQTGFFIVNGETKKPSYEIKENDAISFDEAALQNNSSSQIEPNSEIKLNIIYEDEDVIVLDKPTGISVHPRQNKIGLPLAQESKNTLASALIDHYPAIADVGDNPVIRPGIVHRLDKDTSGTMIVAKNQKSFQQLKDQFKQRLVQKKYIALVVGSPKEDEGTIKTLLARSKSDPSKQVVLTLEKEKQKEEKAKEAITRYKVLEKFEKFSLIEVFPKTGRLHQIRAHFAWLGNPVAGDKKYGPQNKPSLPGLNRQFLHAQQLEITLPSGQRRQFCSELPKDLKIVIASLRQAE